MRKVADLAILRDKCLVVVRKEREGKSSLILPGGKPNEGESDLDCIMREIREELPWLDLQGKFSYYGTFQGISPNKGDIIENRVYLSQEHRELDLRVSENPDEPIKEAMLLPYERLLSLPLSEATRKIVLALRSDSYI